MALFRQLWLKARYSFWFLPTVLVCSAVVLAAALIETHGLLGPPAFERWPRLFGSGAAGARGLLTTVATSMITVAGVVFSITLVALSLASSQYTSRVLGNFMSDRVNQTVLGTFVGIFAYCLVVLRTIRGEDEGAFMPSLAVLVGLLLGFVGIAVLIYFIHHISTSIQAGHILAAVAGKTLGAVDHLFLEAVGVEDIAGEAKLIEGNGPWHPVVTDKTGYLQSLDTTGLLAFARERQTVVRMERGVGQFVIYSNVHISVGRSSTYCWCSEHCDHSRATGRRCRPVKRVAAASSRPLVCAKNRWHAGDFSVYSHATLQDSKQTRYASGSGPRVG